jgi:hypothetical protein
MPDCSNPPAASGAGCYYSETKAAQIDGEVRRFVEEAHLRERKILSVWWNGLNDLAHLFSEKQNVQGDEP